MWVIFNPTPNDLNYDILFNKWNIKAGETKKFPNDVGKEMFNLHGFLKVLERDDEQPQVAAFKPPKSLKDVQEAVPVPVGRDRRVVHPSSNPKVKETMGFNSPDEEKDFGDTSAGLPPTYRKEMEGGKLLSYDKDGVGWYGSGAVVDNPLARE